MNPIELPKDEKDVLPFIKNRKLDIRSVKQDRNPAFVILEIAVKVK